MAETVKANERVILALKPSDKRRRVKIEGASGLFVDVTPSGSMSYQLRYRLNGKSRWKHLGRPGVVRLGQVIETAKRDLSHVEVLKRDIVQERHDAKALGTFGNLFEAWMETYSRRSKTSWRQDEELYRRHISERLGNKMAFEIRRADVRATLESIMADVSRQQARACRAIISAVFAWAEDRELISTSPARGIKLAGKDRPRTRIYTSDELKRFWRALNELPRADDSVRALKLILLTGKRLSEVVTAKVSHLQLDGDDPRWALPLTKNGDPDDVPLAPLALKLFREQVASAASSHYLFPPRDGASRYPHADPKAVTRLRKSITDKLGITGATTHDLRRTFGAETRRLGIASDVRRKLLNHSPPAGDTTSRVYTPYELWKERRAALELWEDELLKIVSRPG